MNKKIIPVILVLVGISTLILTYNHFGGLETFSNSEINLNYPKNWEISENNKNNNIVSFYDNELQINVTVNKQIIPSNYSYETHLNRLKNNNTKNLYLISNKTVEISGKNGIEVIYEDKNQSKRLVEYWVEEKGFFFSIIADYSLNSSKSDNEYYFLIGDYLKDIKRNKSLETILNSFNIKNINNIDRESRDELIWAQVHIPPLNYNWNIRSDTVNGYGSVYHYNESVYPGKNGTSGLLGHRTLFSAPFRNIDQLQPGDLVIIDDYLTLKRYTYQVVSNGNIKWDYRYNPIKFPKNGPPKLILVTCHPPGTKAAAWIVNCDLISVSYLN
ncbi:MAG: sortase domain-bontaining protein [Methanomicrobiales archaeon]